MKTLSSLHKLYYEGTVRTVHLITERITMATHQGSDDELPFGDLSWKPTAPYEGRRWYDERTTADRQPVQTRHTKLQRRCTTPGGTIYLIQFANEVIKVGSSVNPRLREADHRRSTGQTVAHSWASPVHLYHGLNEQAMIAALRRIGRQHEGREWFVGVEFAAAVRLAKSLAFPPLISIDEDSPRTSDAPRRPLQGHWSRLHDLDLGMAVDVEWASLTIFERVGIMARCGLDDESIALREDVPVEVVPGLLWYLENLPDVRRDWRWEEQAVRFWMQQTAAFCDRWEPLVEERHSEIQQQVTSRAASFLAELDANLAAGLGPQAGAASVA